MMRWWCKREKKKQAIKSNWGNTLGITLLLWIVSTSCIHLLLSGTRDPKGDRLGYQRGWILVWGLHVSIECECFDPVFGRTSNLITISSKLAPQQWYGRTKDVVQVLISRTYDNSWEICLWQLVTWILSYIFVLPFVTSITWLISFMQRPYIHPYTYGVFLALLLNSFTFAVTIATTVFSATVTIKLLLPLYHRYY